MTPTTFDEADATIAMGGSKERRRYKNMLREAELAGADADSTIFDRIINGSESAKIIYEDEVCIAFFDSLPVAPVHVLVVPKDRDGLESLCGCEERHKAMLGHLLWATTQVAAEVGIAETGWRTIINNGRDAGAFVDHLHVHVLGGRHMSWPPDSSTCAHMLYGVNRLLHCAGAVRRCVPGREASLAGFDACETTDNADA